ncbi:MAG: chemotaxis response regulator protein-glutamate methylesterase [Chloroflexi bacterium HGW-Chloroflexi-10]|nr:MAG: chemotaxis response regulator protein-glutamate methylesterase [Chloroflexi bacterium HGW-Chloroflexi-10]
MEQIHLEGASKSDSIKVLVVDDSAFMRYTITQYLNKHPQIQVVGSAQNGEEALLMIPRLQPDVVTLDVEMPKLDGLSTLREIMMRFPRPVLMLSSMTKEGAVETIQALTLGAVDFITKPEQKASVNSVMEDVAAKILRVAKAKVRTPLLKQQQSTVSIDSKREAGDKKIRTRQRNEPVVVIGSSTGGPRALNMLIPALPADLPAPVMVIQHMPAGFTRSLAERLDSLSPLKVKEAVPGDQLLVGQVLLAPGGFHTVFDRNEIATMNQNPPIHGVRPAVDVTMSSIVQIYGKNTLAVILTGMGHDGTNGCGLVRSAGGPVIAEDESTCVVWGMPRSVYEAGFADQIWPIHEIASAIVKTVYKMMSGL